MSVMTYLYFTITPLGQIRYILVVIVKGVTVQEADLRLRSVVFKTPAKRIQDFYSTALNIVEFGMLNAFGALLNDGC